MDRGCVAFFPVVGFLFFSFHFVGFPIPVVGDTGDVILDFILNFVFVFSFFFDVFDFFFDFVFG